MDDQMRLKVLIIGDELEALVTAAALQKHGHIVHLFAKDIHDGTERRNITHITPNAHDALQRLGICIPIDIYTSVAEVEIRSSCNEVIDGLSMGGAASTWTRLSLSNFPRIESASANGSQPWILVRESQLREILLAQISTKTDTTVEVEIITKDVREVDLERMTMITNDGVQTSGDVIIGADGTYSIVKSRPGESSHEKDDSIMSIAQVPIDKHQFNRLIDVPDSRGASQVVIASEHNGSRIVAVACPDNSSYDVICLRRAEKIEEVGSGPPERFGGTNISEKRTAIFDMAGADVDRHKLSRTSPLFTHDGASWALVGRASASIVPFLGLNISHTIEDAAALVVVLSNLASRNDIQDRLQLYRNIRHERATETQDFSFKFSCGKIAADNGIKSFLSTFFSHNGYDHAVQQLRRHTWSLRPEPYWRMPIEFGPLPGPRQRHDGDQFASQHSSFVSAIVRFKTERSLLQNLLPIDRSNYRFRSPGTMAYASFMQHTFSNLDWLGGGGYHLLGFYIHGVEHVASNGEILRGTYIPVLFESLADPILSGREELGMPKLFTSIDVHRRENSLRANASWQGAVWGNFAWTGLKEIDLPEETPSAGPAEDGVLCYKYMPRVGNRSDEPADADYPILIPAVGKTCTPVIDKIWKARDASVRLDKLDWEALPTMHHIIARLEEVPILEVVDARVVEGRGVSSAPGTQVIQ